MTEVARMVAGKRKTKYQTSFPPSFDKPTFFKMLLFVLLLLYNHSMIISLPFCPAPYFIQLLNINNKLFHLVGQFSEQMILDFYSKELYLPQMATDHILLIFSTSNLA